MTRIISFLQAEASYTVEQLSIGAGICAIVMGLAMVALAAVNYPVPVEETP